MSSDELQQAILTAVESHGRPKVRRALTDEGVSLHTADKLTGGRYPSSMKELLSSAITRALKKIDRAAS